MIKPSNGSGGHSELQRKKTKKSGAMTESSSPYSVAEFNLLELYKGEFKRILDNKNRGGYGAIKTLPLTKNSFFKIGRGEYYL